MGELSWIEGLATMIGGLLGYMARSFLRRPQTLANLLEIAGIVVRAVEQIAAVQGWNSGQKKKEAERRLARLASFHGLPASADDLDTLIEAAVLALNRAGDERKRPA